MKPDLENLLITHIELQSITGIKYLAKAQDIITTKNKKNLKGIKEALSIIIRPSFVKERIPIAKKLSGKKGTQRISIPFFFLATWFSIFFANDFMRVGQILIGPSIICLTLFYFAFYFIIKGFRKEKQLINQLSTPTRLGVLLDEVDKYNQIIYHIDTSDQL